MIINCSRIKYFMFNVNLFTYYFDIIDGPILFGTQRGVKIKKMLIFRHQLSWQTCTNHNEYSSTVIRPKIIRQIIYTYTRGTHGNQRHP